MKKHRLPRKIKKRLKKKKAAIVKLAFPIFSESIKHIIGFAKSIAFCINTPATQAVIDAFLLAERKVKNEVGIVPLKEPVINRPVGGINIAHYIEEDYPRFNHAADAMDYMMINNGYGIRQPLEAIGTFHLKTV